MLIEVMCLAGSYDVCSVYKYFAPGLLSQVSVAVGVCLTYCSCDFHLQVLKSNGPAAPAPV